MAKIDPSLLTDINEFHLNGACCGVKSEVTLTDLKATVKFCPVCGYESGTPTFEHDDLCFSNPELACDTCRGPSAPEARTEGS